MMPAGPLSYLLGGQQLSARLLGELAGPVEILWAVIAAMVTVGLVATVARKAPSSEARAGLLGFYLVNVAAIAFLCWRGNRVWFIDRIFMPAGLLLLPAMVHFVLVRRTSFVSWLIVGLFGGASVYSLSHAWRTRNWLEQHTAESRQHIRHFGLDANGLRQWTSLDQRVPEGAVAFFTDPGVASLALEWPHWRSHIPAYAAVYGMIDGSPQHLRGRPPALCLIGRSHAPPEYRPEERRLQFVDVGSAAWRQIAIGGLTLCLAGQEAPDHQAKPPHP
jgi:hypothetical protein